MSKRDLLLYIEDILESIEAIDDYLKESNFETLGWEALKTVDVMCEDSWKWQSDNPNGFMTNPMNDALHMNSL